MDRHNLVNKKNKNISNFYHNYWDIFLGLFCGIIALILHKIGYGYFSVFFAALAIGALSVTVSEIAEILAERLDEPYGSFVLTFSAVAVEIILLFMILLQVNNTSSEQVIETVKGGIISAVIVDMNVLLGLAVFVGGLSFKEQQHNEDTSSSYTTMLLVAASALLVPSLLVFGNHTQDDISLAGVLISILLIIFYIAILIFQTKTHSHFFKATARSRILRYHRKKKIENNEDDEDDNYIFEKFSNSLNLFSIFIIIATIGLLAEVFASDGMVIMSNYGVSAGLAGLIIAIISVSPEIFTAIKAAKNDQIQRVVNIAMGASIVSILLTVPILMMLAYMAGIDFNLDFNPLQIGALILTIILAWKTTDDGETNYLEGISHLMFFISYAIIAGLY